MHFTPYAQFRLISDNNCSYSLYLAALEGLSGSLQRNKFLANQCVPE
jgi:hypothetical protein